MEMEMETDKNRSSDFGWFQTKVYRINYRVLMLSKN